MSSIRKDWHFGQDPRVQLSHDLSPTVKLSDSKGGDPPAVLPRLIVSPSHEALLTNVPPENVVAMAEAALE